MIDLRTETYDKKIASIQAKRIYKKLLKLHELCAGNPDIQDKLEDFVQSFDLFIDIIHLLDPVKGEDININVFRGDDPGKEG